MGGHRRTPFDLHAASVCPHLIESLLSICFVGLLGCSTLHRDAQTLMEGEEYGEAAKVYSQILTEDPRDARAIVGLKKSRMLWVDKKLIDVRMLRLAEQAGPAIELLQQIIEREREWQFYPEGAVHYTQEEETKYAVHFITAQFDAWRSKGHLLKSRAFINAHQPIFASSTLVKRYAELNNQLLFTAKEQCQAYTHELGPAYPYFAVFVKRYCDSWGILVDPGFEVGKVRSFPLFKRIEVSGTAEGIPEPLHAHAIDRVTKEFQETAWYDQEATNTLLLGVKTTFDNKHTKTKENAVHSYTVQVPYTVMIPQLQTIPHTTYQQSCTTYGCVSIPFTTYSYEIYTIPVTKYRDDPRQFEYERWRHHQSLLFQAVLTSVIQGTEAEAVYTKTTRDTDTEHPHSLPEIGLYPDRLSLPDPFQWLEKQIDDAAHQYGRALSRTWIRLYCTAPESATTEPALADYAFRCLREPQNETQAFIDSWFQARFGGGYGDVEKWLSGVENPPKFEQELPSKVSERGS